MTGTSLAVAAHQIQQPERPGEPAGWRTVPTWATGRGAELEPNHFCRGRNSKRQKYCCLRAGAGTDHLGAGRCKQHGGSNPVRHGRYALVERPRIRHLMEQIAAAAEDPLDTLPELLMLRALTLDFIERYDEYSEGIITWHASYQAFQRPISAEKENAFREVVDEYEILLAEHGEGADDGRAPDLKLARQFIDALADTSMPPKPVRIMDLADARGLLDTITKAVERIQRSRAAMHISRKDFFRVMTEMGRVVELSNTIADPETRLDAIRDGWKALRLA